MTDSELRTVLDDRTQFDEFTADPGRAGWPQRDCRIDPPVTAAVLGGRRLDRTGPPIVFAGGQERG